MKHDAVSDALSTIKNAENVGKLECTVTNTKLIKSIVGIIQSTGYALQTKESGRSIHIQLAGKINALHAIRPRFAVANDGFEKYEKRYLPSRDVGLIIVSTSQGVMSHREAIQKHIGGRLLAYVY